MRTDYYESRMGFKAKQSSRRDDPDGEITEYLQDLRITEASGSAGNGNKDEAHNINIHMNNYTPNTFITHQH